MSPTTPGEVVELGDINFATATKSYSGSATSGVLTISDSTGHVQFYDPTSTAHPRKR